MKLPFIHKKSEFKEGKGYKLTHTNLQKRKGQI